MEKPVVSVIMPVYNARMYVAKAIESVLRQTFHEFELILIDDGATDGSAEICEKYAKQDSRIVLIHEENGGICKARNTGLKTAKGTYIAFCDHDDLYMPQYLEKAVEAIQKSGAGLVKFAYRSEYSCGGKITNVYEDSVPDVTLKADAILQEPYDLFDLTRRALWNGLYVRKVILDHEVMFDETLRAGLEDFLFNIEYLSYIKEVIYIPDKLFIHYCRSGQSTSAKYSENWMENVARIKRAEIKFIVSNSGTADIIMGQAWKYLQLIRQEFNLEGCCLTMREKSERLKNLRKEDEKLESEIVKAARGKGRGMVIQLGLYACKCYRLLFCFWEIQEKRRKKHLD